MDGGWSAEDVAKHLGKPLTWVQRHASLVRLIEPIRKALENPDRDISRVPVGHLEVEDMLAELIPMLENTSFVGTIKLQKGKKKDPSDESKDAERYDDSNSIGHFAHAGAYPNASPNHHAHAGAYAIARPYRHA